MSPLAAYTIFLVGHWLADFVLQTHWQASNKSKNISALSRHVLVYTGCLAVVSLALFSDRIEMCAGFVLANGLMHFGTDFGTSRWSSRLYAKQDWHSFFVVIGLDQLIHQTTLAGTVWLFFFR